MTAHDKKSLLSVGFKDELRHFMLAIWPAQKWKKQKKPASLTVYGTVSLHHAS
jgi:hypothetical protein